jgi:hypothetical protein
MATIEGLGGGMLLSLVLCGVITIMSHSQSVWSRFKADRKAKERALVFLVSLMAGGFGLWVLGQLPANFVWDNLHFLMGE